MLWSLALTPAVLVVEVLVRVGGRGRLLGRARRQGGAQHCAPVLGVVHVRGYVRGGALGRALVDGLDHAFVRQHVLVSAGVLGWLGEDDLVSAASSTSSLIRPPGHAHVGCPTAVTSLSTIGSRSGWDFDRPPELVHEREVC